MRHLAGLVGGLVAVAVATVVWTFAAVAGEGDALRRITERGVLVLGTAGNMPPLSMTTRDGRVVGFELDLAEAMAGAMGVKLEVRTIPFADLLSALRGGSVDVVISGMTITPRRNLTVAFVGPYLESGKCFLTKLEEISTVEDPAEIRIDGLRLAALEGSTSQAFVQEAIPGATLVTVASYAELTRLVLEDAVHAAVADAPLCSVALARYPEAGLVSVFTLLTYEPLGVALQAGDGHFINWIENFLLAAGGSGLLENLRVKWFEGDGDWLSLLP